MSYPFEILCVFANISSCSDRILIDTVNLSNKVREFEAKQVRVPTKPRKGVQAKKREFTPEQTECLDFLKQIISKMETM